MNRKLQNVLPQNVFVDSLDDMLQRINGGGFRSTFNLLSPSGVEEYSSIPFFSFYLFIPVCLFFYSYFFILEIEGRCPTCGSEMKYTPGLRMCPRCVGVRSVLELRRQPSTKWEINDTFHKQESRQKTRPQRRKFSSREQDAWDIIIHPKHNVLLFSTQHLYETPHQQVFVGLLAFFFY